MRVLIYIQKVLPEWIEPKKKVLYDLRRISCVTSLIINDSVMELEVIYHPKGLSAPHPNLI